MGSLTEEEIKKIIINGLCCVSPNCGAGDIAREILNAIEKTKRGLTNEANR